MTSTAWSAKTHQEDVDHEVRTAAALEEHCERGDEESEAEKRGKACHCRNGVHGTVSTYMICGRVNTRNGSYQ